MNPTFFRSARAAAMGALISGLATAASASTIVDIGTITRFASAEDYSYYLLGSTRFTTSGGAVTLDVLSKGFTGGPNGAGIADAFLWLFSDDGDIGLDDFIAQNDDSADTYGDGSTSSLDSYLSRTLPAGNYIALVGCCEAISDPPTPSNFFIPMGYQGFGGTDPTLGAPSSFAVDYQLTITGPDVAFADQPAAVPLPAGAALLTSALTGLVLARRRRSS